GSRGYGTNRHGLEIAWWIHPGRVHQELEFLLDHVPFRGNEQLLSIACGPSFHESTLAKFFPALQVVATDFDPKEVETGRRIAGEVGVANVEHHALAAQDLDRLPPDHVFDHAISIAALHDIPDPETMCR